MALLYYLATGKMKALFCRLYDLNIGFLLKENFRSHWRTLPLYIHFRLPPTLVFV